MHWEKVLPVPDGLGDPKNSSIYFAPYYNSGLDDRLYISAWEPLSGRGQFLSVRPGSWDWEDVYSQIQPLSWKDAAVGLPPGTDTNRPLEPQCIGPMTIGYKLGQGHVPHATLYVCARSPIYHTSGGQFASPAAVVYEGSPSPLAGNPPMSWKVEAVLPRYVTDPAIIGFKERIFVSLVGEDGKAEIGTNASGVWGTVGQEIGAYNPENQFVSSFYNSTDVLYAGTWGNMRTEKGAEIWKTKDGLTWELEHSFPDKADRGIDSMTEFRGNLYAGTDNHSGTHIWRRENTTQWRDVPLDWASVVGGAGRKSIKTLALRSHGDTLYAGTGRPPFILTSQDGVNWDFDTTIWQATDDLSQIMDLNWFHDRIDLEHGPAIFYGPEALFAGVENSITGAQFWHGSNVPTLAWLPILLLEPKAAEESVSSWISILL